MEETFVSIDGHAIFTKLYTAQNASDKQTIVFLHEALGSVAQWRDFPKYIAEQENCNVLVYDRLGHGLSDPMTQKRDLRYLHHEAWTVLPSLLAHFGIQKPILWGHSDGGSIALLYASLFPTWALITEAAHVFVEPVTLDGIREAVTRKDFLIDRLKKYHGDKTHDLWDAWADTWLQKSFEVWNIEEHLPNIQCSALIIQGENDAYGSIEQVNRIAKGIGQKAKVVLIPNCGHTPHKEAREIVLKNISKF